MKPIPLLIAAFLALPPLFALLHAAPALEPAAAWAAPDAGFREKFKKLMEKAQKPEMEKLVKSESSHAAAWIARAHEILAERPDDPEVGPFLAELTTAWKTGMKSEFPEKEKEFFTKLEGQNKGDRVDLRRRFDKVQGDFDANAEKRDAWLYAQMVDEIEVLASAFDQIGDHYYSSEAWLLFAACYDEPLRGATADYKRALTGYEKALAERVKVDLSDTKKETAEKRKTALAAKAGGKDAPAAGGAEPSSQEPTDAGASLTLPLTFDMIPGPETFQRPNYMADDIYLNWTGVVLKKKGSTGTFENTPGAPTLYRVGSSDVRIDVDGDGKADGPADQKIPLTGNMEPVKVMLGTGESARPWAFLGIIATQQESYQGMQANMAPDDDDITIRILCAASVTGTLEGQPFRIIDDSMDGVYGSDPQNYGFEGLTKGVYQPLMDSIVIGGGKRARPWSEFQEVGGKWWKFEMASPGKEIKASPVKVDTGTLKLEYKGGVAPTYVVLRGVNAFKNCFYDLVEGGAKGVQVPVGRYQLAYGEVRKGKKKQMQKCVILPPAHNAPTYDVTKGSTMVVTLGAPYSIDFTYKNDDGKVTVTGQSVAVTGSSGERYERPWACVLHPEAGWRKKGAKTAGKYVKLPIIQDIPTVERLGWEATWFPLDLVLEAKGQGDVEVQLVEKKHDLFGKLESVWK